MGVLKHRKKMDVYTKEKITRDSIDKFLELDHVVELHVIRDCYDAIPKQGTGFSQRKKELATCLRENIVNGEQVSNLNFTKKPINEHKFEAVYEFQRKYNDKTKVATDENDQGLFVHLEKWLVDAADHRISRSTTRRIQSEMFKSWKLMEEAIEEEQPLQCDFMDLLRINMVAMKLK
ncbi:unnamed protein product [Pseudo-nitzschia multistriata]|uniref:Uncharacterized protein n=1 Tax=Pseudo-nitzschia multistriata TaxID=183589 RepID=A0A448Z1M1_9STRA|nr:unnamed protein product [Pseudo-nitzschia multistriata]